ncbi:arsenate reductase (glutaredoxin) [Psychromonas sp. B3M02]|uniref:arsenate reductase (glutaredoxin) n=1 Tax=Psychromonas sp. B3M02 TaxID=2267226 RepID=UPI000DE8CE42|nr:arsenate reductase (glutaredoxin) [Psychromonas sp. B3M02]RBW41336.1 arsenate reductase (glutaredoxin) [Psychromonas sp. B3M02]
MTDITFYHNPRCSKSRETLALVDNEQHQVEIIKYLTTPPSVETIAQLIKQLGFDSARQLMRTKETLYKELNLASEQDEAALIAAMQANPKLIERPIVVANGKAAIGRPPESVLTIL